MRDSVISIWKDSKMNFISKDSYLEEVVSPGIRTLQSRKGHVLTEGAGESWGAGGEGAAGP